jgi:xanthine dehydrogenase iron-sulfur cluster and FAD-binding subunit A
MWHEYFSVTSVEEAYQILADRRERARIVAGGTDLILEIERGVRQGIEAVIDVSRIPGLHDITLDEDEVIHLGPLVTHNDCVESKLIQERALPLAEAAWEVGAPQIRNMGTVAGNLITASPANDTITPLMALDAWLTLASTRGERTVRLADFYQGVRKTVMEPDEMLVDIAFPAMRDQQRGAFLKLGLRRAQAISLVNTAIVIGLDRGRVTSAAITLGAVAPVIVHAAAAEEYLVGRELDEETMSQAAGLAMGMARPIDDVRSSAEYRREMVRVCVLRALRAAAGGKERTSMPARPVLLSGNGRGPRPVLSQSRHFNGQEPIVTRINGQEYTFHTGHEKTLLRLLREEGGLIGTKEGCSEGECGACTVFLDGKAVMGCLVPAGRAHQAEIVTIEGLAQEEQLHPLQQAFIDAGAVQCGYCTPGFIMAGVKLLEERPHPSRDEIRQAITGNLCRCTGYYMIIDAIEKASQEMSHGKV